MKPSGIAAMVVFLCLSGRAAAQTATPQPAYTAKVFVSVDQVLSEASRITVTGILQGEAVPSTWYMTMMSSTDAAASAQYAEICQRLALLAMAKPGQYLLEIQSAGGYTAHRCKLSRATP